MSGNVLEFFIKMTDLTGRAIASATANVKKFARNIAADLGFVQKTLDSGLAPEKFVHTTAVLDEFARAMGRAGIKGKEFSDAYGALRTQLNEFNKTGEDSDALMQRFRASMENLGFSVKDVESGLAMLQQEMVKVEKSGKEAATRFSALRAINAALRGDFAALAAELTKLVPKFREAGVAGAKGMFIAGAAVTSVIKLFGALKDLVKTAFNLGGPPKEIREVNAKLSDIRTHASAFAASMEEARESAKGITEQLNSEIDSLERLTKAQNNLARAQELARANSQYETDEINAKYDRLNAEAGERAAKSRRDLQRDNLQAEAKRLNAEIEEATKRRDESRAAATKLLAAAKEKRGGWGRKRWGWAWAPTGLGSYFGNLDETRSILAGQTDAANEADMAEEQIAEARKKLLQVEAKLRALKSEEKTARIETETRKQTEANEEYSRDLAEYQREAKEAEREWRDAVREREAAEREAAKAARERHRERMRDAHEEASATREVAAAAQSRLDSARAQASEAWGFYLDRDSLASHNQGVDRGIEARKRYEREYRSLMNGRNYQRFRDLQRIARRDGMGAVEAQLSDWRSKKAISLDTEATMRVAVSEAEEAAARKAAIKTADAAERAAESLEAIQYAFEEGGEA
ncbi:MAG: hypothetical protein IJG84_03565 [Kiritimatiellae bacterium]|nr:hypothetical protein [Kiritimatiellia bacterium]